MKTRMMVGGLLALALCCIMLAGCGGAPNDLSGIAPNQPNPADLTAGKTPVVQNFSIEYKDVPEPVDVLDENSQKGGTPTTIAHLPMIWRGGKFNAQAPIVGRRFVGPGGSYSFTSIDQIAVGAGTKAGIPYTYRVTDRNGMIIAKQSPNVWGLNMPGWYIVRASAPGVPAYTFYLEIEGVGSGNVVMDAMAINPATGREYRPNAKGECEMLVSNRAFVIPTWYNFLTGKKVGAPNMYLIASAWLEQPNTVMSSNGNGQDYTAIGTGTTTVGLSIYPPYGNGLGTQGKGGIGASYYWYSRVTFTVCKG